MLIARLEDKLGFDPFTAAKSTFFPVIFGDFVKVYEIFALSAAVLRSFSTALANR